MMKRRLPTFCLLLAMAMPALAQKNAQPGSAPVRNDVDYNPQGISYSEGHPWWKTLFGQSAIPVAPLQLANSSRVQGLLRNGKLYVSLNDAIALALENNLDIAIQRYNLSIADTDILRAKSGSGLRGVSTGIVSGTPGGGGATTGGAGATGGGPGGTTTGVGGAGAGTQGIVTTALGGGPTIGNLDPFFQTNLEIQDNTSPQTSPFSGTNSLIQHLGVANFSYNQSFLTGTSLSVGYNNTRNSSNNTFSLFNPFVNSTFSMGFTQRLLQGFGRGVNSRNIVIARNDRAISDLAFKQQVMATVSQVEDIYWNTVSTEQAVRVAQESVDLAKKILADNQRQVQIGTLAPISVTQAQAQLATNQQQLIVAQTNYQYQQLLLKNAITRNMADPILAATPVVATDQIQVPRVEPVQPVQDLIELALKNRPELGITKINLNNSQISLKALKNGLLPTLDLIGTYNGQAVAGSPQTLGNSIFKNVTPSPQFVGGYGQTLSQLFSNNFPGYMVGVSLQIPIFNHSGQADVVNGELGLRQQQLQQRQQTNQIILEVRQAQYTVVQDRAQVEAAQESVRLNRETLNAEQKKFDLGASTVTNVLTDQTNLTQAETNLVNATTAYQEAKVNLNRLTGMTLQADRILLDDAIRGQVTQMPKVSY